MAKKRNKKRNKIRETTKKTPTVEPPPPVVPEAMEGIIILGEFYRLN